jgi:hypothetical protein
MVMIYANDTIRTTNNCSSANGCFSNTLPMRSMKRFFGLMSRVSRVRVSSAYTAFTFGLGLNLVAPVHVGIKSASV